MDYLWDTLTQCQCWLYSACFVLWPVSFIWFLLPTQLSPDLIPDPALHCCLPVSDLGFLYDLFSAGNFVLCWILVADPNLICKFVTVPDFVTRYYLMPAMDYPKNPLRSSIHTSADLTGRISGKLCHPELMIQPEFPLPSTGFLHGFAELSADTFSHKCFFTLIYFTDFYTERRCFILKIFL